MEEDNKITSLYKNKGGHPPIFETPEEMQGKIDEYFNLFQKQESTIYGSKPTRTGLALFLGFSSRQSLYDYKNKKEFSYTIKKALLALEMIYELMLSGKNATGAIFALKNIGWSDKQEIDLNINKQIFKIGDQEFEI